MRMKSQTRTPFSCTVHVASAIWYNLSDWVGTMSRRVGLSRRRTRGSRRAHSLRHTSSDQRERDVWFDEDLH